MADSTGQLDKLIEDKVDNKIKDFAKSLTDQITNFLKDNGDYHGEYLYVVTHWEKDKYGMYLPLAQQGQSIYQVQRGLAHGLSLTIKNTMIKKETQQLLEKVALLS